MTVAKLRGARERKRRDDGLDNREWSGETDVKRSLAQRFWNIVGAITSGC